MIVRQFIEWARKARREERAEASGALARAYLYSDLSTGDRGAAEGAMLTLLDDSLAAGAPGAGRRARREPGRAWSRGLCALPTTGPRLRRPCWRCRRSLSMPIWSMPWRWAPMVQSAIASRAALPRSVAAAVAEVGSAEACLVLLNNRDADIAPFSLDRIVERYGHLGAIREPLAARADLSVDARQTLVAKIGESLAGYAVGREWLDVDNALRIAREACEKMKVVAHGANAGRRDSPAHSTFAREWTAHGWPDPARAPVGQYRFVRRRARRTCRHSGRTRVGLYPWRQP